VPQQPVRAPARQPAATSSLSVLLWGLALLGVAIVLWGLLGFLGLALAVSVTALVLAVVQRRKNPRATPLDPMRAVGWLFVVAGFAVLALTVPVVKAKNERSARVHASLMDQGIFIRYEPASPLPGFIAGGAILCFGVLVLAIRRPQPPAR
jgi:multisubunit Na+/H+ antiporter MnhB subunit